MGALSGSSSQPRSPGTGGGGGALRGSSAVPAPKSKDKKKGGNRLLGALGQVRDVVTGAGPALIRFGGSVISEAKGGARSGGLVGALGRSGGDVGEAVNPLSVTHRETYKATQPLLYEMATSPARTARQVPDLAVAALPGGAKISESDIAKQIREEGVLSTALAKVGDVALLAGGVGAVGKAAGATRLPEASRLTRLAGATSEAAGLGKAPSYVKLSEAAAKAAAAGDAVRAADLTKAAQQVLRAAELQTSVAGASKAARAAEKVTAGAGKVSRGFDQASALPFVPTQKALGVVGKGLGAAAKSERLAPIVSRLDDAVARRGEKVAVGDLYHETVRAPFEGEMHALFERFGVEDIAKNLSKDEQAAIYLSKSKEALDPAVLRLLDEVDQLPAEVRPDALRRILPDVSPEAFDLARRFDEGSLPEAQQSKLSDAADRLTEVQKRRETERYVSGRGTSAELSEGALEARRQRAAGQSAEMDVQSAVERRTARTQGRLAGIRSEMDALNAAPAPEPVPFSPAQEQQAARLAERTRRADLAAQGEQARADRLAGTVLREQASGAARESNRIADIVGRGRARMEEAGQLETGLARRKRQAELKARREARAANAAEDNAAKLAAADEARAEANRIKGIKAAPSLGQVQRDINQQGRLATAKSRAEQTTADRLLAAEAKRQGDAVAKAQRKLESAQSQERATLDRFERENQVRADRAQQRRFDTLQKREADALDRLARETEEARNSVEAAPPQDRPALLANRRAKEFALELAEAHPERASEFAALADDIATTKSALDAKGIKTEYFFGGPELDKTTVPPPTAKLRNVKKLQSERARKSGTLARSVKAQAERYAQETLDILHNEFRGKAQDAFGSTVKAELRPDRFATGDDLAVALSDNGLVAWDPKTGKLLDAKDISADSAVLPSSLYESLKSYTAKREPGILLKGYDKVTGGWKHAVLALSPRWHVGNIIGNAALATLGAGLSPADIVTHVGEARRLVKAFEGGGDVPPQHLQAMERLIAAGFNNPDLAKIENARAIGRAINKSYHFNGYVDSVNRTMVYLAKHEKGVSAEAAVQMALKASGDFSKMTPFERNVVRRILPFYSWQRHITRLAVSLPLEHPTRVAWTLHLAELQNRLHPDPGAENEFNEGTIPLPGGKRLNVRQAFPFSSSFWTDPSYRGGGYQLNPLIKTSTAALTGFNLGKMKPVSGKFHEARDETPSGFGAPVKYLPPGAIARLVTQQIPQIQTAQDLVAGEAPVRYDTGEPRKVGKGATKKNAKPTLTGRGRKETISRFLGVPVPEPEQKPVTKKR